jgi:TonB family protein
MMVTFLVSMSWGSIAVGRDGAAQAEKETTVVKPEKAAENLVKKVAPVYPPLAKHLRLQGKVTVQVVISKTGNVASVKVLSGHPLFAQAAIDAVKQWQYKPFFVRGKPVAASTEFELPFSLDISGADYQVEERKSQIFFKSEDECQSLLKAQKYSEAEAICKSLVGLSEKLPIERHLERMTANELAGHSLLYQKKFTEALSFFQSELVIGKAALKPTDAELGYAYHHVGLAYYGAGDLHKAQSYYEHSESTLRAARDHMDGEFFKNQYAKDIQGVLQEYIVILRQTGQEDAAAQAQKRLDAIAQDIRPFKTP